MSWFLYADNLDLLSETIEGLRNKFLKWKEAYKSKGLKVNLAKTEVMVSGGITKDGMSKYKVDQCWVCSLTVKSNSVLCVQYDKWIHSRCAGVKSVTTNCQKNFTCIKCKGNNREAKEPEQKLCDKMKAAR